MNSRSGAAPFLPTRKSGARELFDTINQSFTCGRAAQAQLEFLVAHLFANPNLPNYFLPVEDISSVDNARSLVDDYEAAKVITFPNLKAAIDHEFWAALDTDRYATLKKFGPLVHPTDHENVESHARGLAERGIDEPLIEKLCEQFRVIYGLLIPIYLKIFGEYQFDRRKVMWRLNTIMNENMHVDTYKEENEQHFARMFVNLDTQPRIWQTSWTIHEMLGMLDDRIPASALEGKTRAEIWMTMNQSIFGKTSREWWDNQPRHVAYFDPGDVWIVDSRQVSHQIFYGRRALSIDFSLPRAAMKNVDRHYLAITERFRDSKLRAAA